MKKLLSVLTVFTLLFIGCSNDVNINSPADNQTTEEVVTRDVPDGLQINTLFTVSKDINGALGGSLFTGNIIETKNGKSGSVYGSLSFLAGAFSGTKTITMTLDNKKLMGTFSPGMALNIPASFSVLFSGVNLSGYEQSQFAFVYYDVSGIRYEIPYTYLYFDKVKGVLGILNAQLPHFSRYAFIKKT